MDDTPFKHVAAALGQAQRSYQRRLSDKNLIAFDQPCETGNLVVAQELLVTLETLFARPSAHHQQDRRKNIESLVNAHLRLWALRDASKPSKLQIAKIVVN